MTIEEATNNRLQVEYYSKLRWCGIGEELKNLADNCGFSFRISGFPNPNGSPKYGFIGSGYALFGPGALEVRVHVQQNDLIRVEFREHTTIVSSHLITQIDEVDKIQEMVWNWFRSRLHWGRTL